MEAENEGPFPGTKERRRGSGPGPAASVCSLELLSWWPPRCSAHALGCSVRPSCQVQTCVLERPGDALILEEIGFAQRNYGNWGGVA